MKARTMDGRRQTVVGLCDTCARAARTPPSTVHLPSSTPWLLLALILLSCGDPKAPKHELEGSLQQLLTLGYDVARVEQSGDAVAVVFVRTKNGEDVVLKVTSLLAANLPDGGTALPVEGPFDLAENTPQGVQRGVVSRSVLGDPHTTFPLLSHGGLSFAGPLKPSSTVSGKFNATFVDGVDYASGRTAFGDFTAEVP